MSSQKPGSTSGTQSPPLEATGSEKPMGVCSIDGRTATYVPDLEQRKAYFTHLCEFGPDKDKAEAEAKKVEEHDPRSVGKGEK